MQSLVTGGAGFIGSHLVDRLLAEGHKVRVIDNFACGHRDNLSQHAGNPALEIHEIDITEAEAIRPLFEGVDWVFHLAAMADIVPSIKNPGIYHHANVDGTIAVLEAARAAGVKRFLYTASSSAYGFPDTFPTPETAPPRPMYPYALTKWVGEQYVLHWGQTYDMPVVSLRLFNVYGPRHRTAGTYGAMFGVFLAQKLAGKPYTVVGDGTQTRDFTFVTDVADAFFTAASSDLCNEVMNVGSDGTYAVNRIVELLQGEVLHIPKRPGEPDCTWADISKIKRLLGWSPKVSLEQGVGELLKHIDCWSDAPVWTPDTIKTATVDWFKYLGKGEPT
ncbi:UDP-glucose 4-epimerase [Paramagnetospirillum caucaseum]|uniref:UDP-glucose 4-epimerase n=1 Tax=Paramagnetospirillum caucaseum TaxID=1244869 RepID=M2ZT68_9PROT|nr:SDR family oxidoreductase [Paramagnetospirillum caucaseum]EME70552.1 UDP-glucose 4-epimerase [Paramagnetospirillum caucaseum]